jgi:hypothetical protein
MAKAKVRVLNLYYEHALLSKSIFLLCRVLNGNFIVQSQLIRHRKDMKLFERFHVNTSIYSFSDSELCFYVESRFENKENFVCAVHYTKYRIVSPDKFNPITPSSLFDFPRDSRSDKELETIKSFIAAWEETNRISSSQLRPKSN